MQTSVHRLTQVATIAIIALLATPIGVAAADGASPRSAHDSASLASPDVDFAAMSEEDRQRAIDVLEVTKITTDAPDPSPAVTTNGLESVQGAGCWTVTWGRSGYNALGWELWSLKQRIDWCGNGSTISSASRTRWVEVYVVGWSGSIVQDPVWGGVGQWSYRAFSQAHFQLDIVYPVQHKYPWLDMTVTASGGLTGSGGGS